MGSTRSVATQLGTVVLCVLCLERSQARQETPECILPVLVQMQDRGLNLMSAPASVPPDCVVVEFNSATRFGPSWLMITALITGPRSAASSVSIVLRDHSERLTESMFAKSTVYQLEGPNAEFEVKALADYFRRELPEEADATSFPPQLVDYRARSVAENAQVSDAMVCFCEPLLIPISSQATFDWILPEFHLTGWRDAQKSAGEMGVKVQFNERLLRVGRMP